MRLRMRSLVDFGDIGDIEMYEGINTPIIQISSYTPMLNAAQINAHDALSLNDNTKVC